MRALATLSMNKDDPTKAIAKIKLEIKGLPKSVSEDSDQVEFKVDLEVRAIYKWDEAVTQEELDVQEVNAILAQPLFLRATDAAESLLSNLGIRGIKLDTDIRVAEHIEVQKPAIQSPRSVASKPKKTSGKKVAPT